MARYTLTPHATVLEVFKTECPDTVNVLVGLKLTSSSHKYIPLTSFGWEGNVEVGDTFSLLVEAYWPNIALTASVIHVLEGRIVSHPKGDYTCWDTLRDQRNFQREIKSYGHKILKAA